MSAPVQEKCQRGKHYQCTGPLPAQFELADKSRVCIRHWTVAAGALKSGGRRL